MDGILVLISIAHNWLLLYCNTIDFLYADFVFCIFAMFIF